MSHLLMCDLIKQELHKMINQCNNEVLLAEAKELLQTEIDWWNELSEQDKNLVMESEVQFGKGDFIDHKELMQRFEEWKKK
jgi:hypothetical protein